MYSEMIGVLTNSAARATHEPGFASLWASQKGIGKESPMKKANPMR